MCVYTYVYTSMNGAEEIGWVWGGAVQAWIALGEEEEILAAEVLLEWRSSGAQGCAPATHRSTPQQTATQCNTLQHTATDCNNMCLLHSDTPDLSVQFINLTFYCQNFFTTVKKQSIFGYGISFQILEPKKDRKKESLTDRAEIFYYRYSGNKTQQYKHTGYFARGNNRCP